jgi:hypothetical protein
MSKNIREDANDLKPMSKPGQDAVDQRQYSSVQNPLGRNDQTYWNSVENNRTQFPNHNPLTQQMLRDLPGGKPHSEPERTGQENPGTKNFDAAKDKNADDSAERLRQSRDGLKDGRQSANVQQSGIYYNRPGISS